MIAVTKIKQSVTSEEEIQFCQVYLW